MSVPNRSRPVKPGPVLTHVVYMPVQGKEKALLDLVKRHWPALRKAGLSTEEPAQIYRAIDKHSEREYFIEIFSWRDEAASARAHEMPEVMSIWEPMGAVLEGGRGPQSIAELEKIAL